MTDIDVVFENASIVNAWGTIDGWVAVSNSRISAVGAGKFEGSPHRRIDVAGRTLVPGRVDPHIHFGVYQPYEQDVGRTSGAAAIGGTTVVMPMNRDRRSYFDVFSEWSEIFQRSSPVDILPHLQIQTRDHIRELPAYRDALGTKCFKLHLDYRSELPWLREHDIASLDDGDVYETMLAARTCGAIVAAHCQNVEVEARTLPKIQAEGREGLIAWDAARPPIAEALDIQGFVTLAEHMECPSVIVHVSSAEGIDALRKHPGQRWVSAETLVHFLTSDSIEAEARVGAIQGKVNPPLRGPTHREALWDAIETGHINTIGTDHVLCDKSGAEEFWDAPASNPGIQFAFPLMVTAGVETGLITLPKMVELMCWNPARLYGLADRKGAIAPGFDADIVMLDVEQVVIIDESSSFLRERNLAWNMEVRGVPTLTMRRGTVIAAEGQLVEDAGGRVLRGS